MHGRRDTRVLFISGGERHDGQARRPRLYRLLSLILPVLLLVGAGGCARSNADGSQQQVIVTGSTTILPITEEAREGFEEANQGTSVLVSGLGSSAGIEAVAAGTSDIGTSSRDLKEEEEGLGLVDTPVAFDGIAVIVNPENPVKALTLDQLRDIFAGKITNWSQVGGQDLKIDLVNRDEASGTREAFKKIVMGEDARFDKYAVVLPGTGQVRDVVARTPSAVGYISVGFVEPRFTSTHVKALAIDGVQPNEKTVADKTYPIARTLHFFTKGEATGLTKQFIDYVLSDDVQDGVVVEAGFVPVKEGAK